MTLYDIGYTACAIDGEGFIGATEPQATTQGSVKVGITNTAKEWLERIHCDFGGALHTHGKPRAVNHKQGWVLLFNGRKAIPILKVITPHLRMKKRQAELALLFAGTISDGGNGATKQSTLDLRGMIYDELIRLNKRGVEICA